MRLLLVFALLLLSTPALSEDAPQVHVVNGRAEAVFYGWSPVTDMWGNARKAVWTLRKDGFFMFSAPDGSLADFAGRALTAEEKADCGTYAIDGSKFKFTYRDGSAGEGEVEYHPHGGIKLIKAAALRFYPVRPLTFQLSGYFANTLTVNNGAYGISTSVYSSYYFYPNGTFVLDSGHATTCVKTETFDSIEREVMGFYGADAKSMMGKFEAKRDSLVLNYADGRTETKFLAQFGDDTSDGTALILIGRSLCDGKPGRFPGDPDIAKLAQFELKLPKGWKESREKMGELDTLQLTPGEGSDIIVLAVGLDVDVSTEAADKETVKGLREFLATLIGRKLASAGEVEEMQVAGGSAVRIPTTFDRDGTPIRADAIYSVKSGRAMLLIALGTMESATSRAEELQALLAGASFAVEETKKAKAADFELNVPKAWKAKEDKAEGASTLALSIPGVEEGQFFAGVVTQATEFKSAGEKEAIAWLRQQVTGTVPGVEKQGGVRKLAIDGEPAVGLTYGAETADGDAVILHAYSFVRKGKIAILLMGGRRAFVEKYGGAALRAFETIKPRK